MLSIHFRQRFVSGTIAKRDTPSEQQVEKKSMPDFPTDV